MTQENSVITALSELQTLEDNRLEQEQRDAQQRRQQEKQAQDAYRLACIRRKRVAEQEKRDRIDKDLQRRNVEVDARIAALKSELAAVQLAREEIRLRLLSAYQPSNVDRHETLLKWKLAFFSALTLALILLVFHWVSPRHPLSDATTSKRIDSVQVVKPIKVGPSHSTRVVHKEETLGKPQGTQQNNKESIAIKKSGHKTKTITGHRNHSGKESNSTNDILDDLDSCGDDPTCGLTGKEMEMRWTR